MGTRLLSEHLIKKRYPHLKYVRIHTIANNTAAIYAWNDNLQLPDKEIAILKNYASGYLLQHVCYKVKSYDMVQTDRVPQVEELPELIIQTAMSRNLNQDRIVGIINGLFSNGSMTFNSYDMITGTIHYDFHSSKPVMDIEKELIRQYLYEITPLGAYSEVTYCQERAGNEKPTDLS
ncbi:MULTISPECIES: hypothetical protein [unclassified Paenibacillus]|uniref:hypothetical protein n=1 Tax=unclassified Paenibacillus TaxID=185978 RepID=UPI001B6CABBE|nr:MULTISPECIES: hypothetical protein [unclassified Paenibacillus]MBP1155867.1 hypothetical protein [Paenibacillus sp. PvP091]MBP1168747.1 hypothetical protein [Paenibacillus sp. PvR098]MBP2439775.1 hypothetical protein [Paenibacillus sp. PvP052]